jgi:hypothetical protein
MHIILGILALAASAYFLIMRARRGAEMASDLLDVADDIRAAARRFGFHKKYNQHPIESVDTPNLALGALATAFIELDDLPTAETRENLQNALQEHALMTRQESEEVMVLGRWLVFECTGAVSAVPRLAKKLRELDKEGAGFAQLMSVLQEVAAGQSQGLSQRQKEALEELKTVFRLR